MSSATLGRLLATIAMLLLPGVALAESAATAPAAVSAVTAAAPTPASASTAAPPLQAANAYLDAQVPGVGRYAESGSAAPPDLQDPLPQADLIVVRKSERRLYLMRRGEVLRSYRVALGLNPVGHKERSGDFRTPEGRYRIERRNPRSDFFLSMQVSYPNSQDAANARRNGWAPGGSIMIHGLPNEPRKNADYYATQDWTDGCIAVSNAEMLEIWMFVSNNTPIEIEP
jgi:lipoprotein-anchoring transpeptidase ErfK/SrfK